MADSLFPFIDATVSDVPESEDITISQEYDWDFVNNEFKLVNGKPSIVTGVEALKIWSLKALQTERYRYPAYTWEYGQEFDDIMGQPFSSEVAESEAERYLKECLLINPHITNITNVSATFDGDNLSIDFTEVTDQGEVEINV